MPWILLSLVLIVALLIPILAIVLDSPALRSVFERRAGGMSLREIQDLATKVTRLEGEVEDLGRTVQLLKEETEFLQRLLENPEQRPAPRSLTSPNP
jgi:hypothetical protein